MVALLYFSSSYDKYEYETLSDSLNTVQYNYFEQCSVRRAMRRNSCQHVGVDVKENIIEAATELIRKSNGDLDRVSIRTIANQADVSIGLINYHFGSKKKLIEVCVERIIEQVIHSFTFNQETRDEPKDQLFSGTISVFTFLGNPEIAKVSMISDLFSSCEC